jgi:hypothetical protein
MHGLVSPEQVSWRSRIGADAELLGASVSRASDLCIVPTAFETGSHIAWLQAAGIQHDCEAAQD